MHRALRIRHFELVIEHPSRATSFPELFCHTGKKSMEREWHEMLFTVHLTYFFRIIKDIAVKICYPGLDLERSETAQND